MHEGKRKRTKILVNTGGRKLDGVCESRGVGGVRLVTSLMCTARRFGEDYDKADGMKGERQKKSNTEEPRERGCSKK